MLFTNLSFEHGTGRIRIEHKDGYGPRINIGMALRMGLAFVLGIEASLGICMKHIFVRAVFAFYTFFLKMGAWRLGMGMVWE